MTGLAGFLSKWCTAEYGPIPVHADALEKAEYVLKARLPVAYRMVVLSLGLPQPNLSLLHSIVEANLNLADVNHFCTPEQMIENTTVWRSMGLPAEMVAFASDCNGNLFVFDPEERVAFFDHDEADVTVIADSFDEWIDAFAQVPFVDWDD